MTRRDLIAEDECPYRRPFLPDFTDCPAYWPRPFIPLDLRHQPLRAAWTCAHLEVGTIRRPQPRFYARCSLGKEAARLSWSQDLQQEAFHRLTRLGRESGERLRPLHEAMWEAKIAQLESAPDERRSAETERALREAVSRFLAEQEAFLWENAADLEFAGMPVEAVIEITRAQLAEFESRKRVESEWLPPPELLARIPPAYRTLFRATSSRALT